MHHERPAEPLEERAEAVEHWRGQDLTDDEAPLWRRGMPMPAKRPDWPWWLRLLVLLLFGVFYLPILVFVVALSCGGVCQ